MRLITEKEHINTSQQYIFKLRKLYLEDKELFMQLQDFLPFPLYIKSQKSHDYDFCNNNFYSVGEEMEKLSRLGLKYLYQISDITLARQSIVKGTQFFKENDHYATLSYKQCMLMNNKMTPFMTNKVILKNDLSLNVAILPQYFSSQVEKLYWDLVPDRNKDSILFQKFQTLTKREKEVLQLVILGFTNLQISEILSIAFNTVRTHRNKIWKKLEIKHFRDCLEYQYFF